VGKTGWKKAATLLTVLTEQERERIIGELDAVTADRLRREIDRLGPVPVKVARAIRREFLEAMKAPAPEISLPEISPKTPSPRTTLPETTLPKVSSPETAAPERTALEAGTPELPKETAAEERGNPDRSIFPPELSGEEISMPVLESDGNNGIKNYRIDTGPYSSAGPHFLLSSTAAAADSTASPTEEPDPDEWIGPNSALSYPDTEFLYAQIADERPQTCAAFLARLPQAAARTVLKRFDEPKRQNIEQRLARIGTIEPEIWEDVERILDTVPNQHTGAETAEAE